MKLTAQVKSLIIKEIKLEWRSKYALNGILLYVVSTVFVCFLSFKTTPPLVWNALFWIIMLFAAINAIAKSFMQESKGRLLYYYQIASPVAIIISKIVYNIGLMLFMASIAFIFYNVVFDNPIEDIPLYLLSVFIGAFSFSTVFTMISAIAAKAGNNATLMAILSFPVILPLLILIIKLSKNAMDGLDRSVSYDEIAVLCAINAIVIAVSLILFPYLWRD
jgi:heme exporter protein B